MAVWQYSTIKLENAGNASRSQTAQLSTVLGLGFGLHAGDACRIKEYLSLEMLTRAALAGKCCSVLGKHVVRFGRLAGLHRMRVEGRTAQSGLLQICQFQGLVHSCQYG